MSPPPRAIFAFSSMTSFQTCCTSYAPLSSTPAVDDGDGCPQHTQQDTHLQCSELAVGCIHGINGRLLPPQQQVQLALQCLLPGLDVSTASCTMQT